MSALRIDTLRIVWLEAFVAVAEVENMSEAAGLLGVSQPSMSRYVQALETWTGKKLVVVGGVRDPENPRVSIGVTDEGQDFFELAQAVLTDLANFRSPGARYQEARDDIQDIVCKLEADLRDRSNDVAKMLRPNIETFRHVASTLHPDIESFRHEGETNPDKTILDFVESFRRNIRIFFTEYENRCADAKRRKRGKVKRRTMDKGVGSDFAGTDKA